MRRLHQGGVASRTGNFATWRFVQVVDAFVCTQRILENDLKDVHEGCTLRRSTDAQHSFNEGFR